MAEPKIKKKRTCSECLHFGDPYREGKRPEIRLGECHLNPPKVVNGMKRAHFPLVAPDDWCGQFTRRIDYHE